MPAFKWANTVLGNKAAITGTYRSINSKQWAAVRTTSMPYWLLKLAEAYNVIRKSFAFCGTGMRSGYGFHPGRSAPTANACHAMSQGGTIAITGENIHFTGEVVGLDGDFDTDQDIPPPFFTTKGDGQCRNQERDRAGTRVTRYLLTPETPRSRFARSAGGFTQRKLLTITAIESARKAP